MSVPTATVLSEGKVIDSTYEIVSIDIRKELNRIPHAQLTLVDGDVARGFYAISDETVFEPGKRIEIKLRYEGGNNAANVSVFKGIVVGHGVSANTDGSSFLTVELKDDAVKSTLVCKRAVYREMTDTDVAKQIIANNGLSSRKLEATLPKHAELVQYNCTDWDFLLSRAEANGLVVVVNNGTVSIDAINLNRQAKHRFESGVDIHDFEIEAGAESQLSGVESLAWDIAAQAPTKPARATEFLLTQGNLKGAHLAGAFGLGDRYQLTDLVPLTPDELKAWSDGRLMRSRLSLIRGRVAAPGLGNIALLDVIKISRIGKRFNGATVVTGLHHRFDVHGWQTNIQFGLTARQFAERRDLSEMPAAGLLPAVNGLQIGVVGEFEEDSTGNLRVKVLLPAIDPKTGFVWARLASPEAGHERGYFFRPEPGDEVVVGFFNDDPRQAVILGGLYSSANAAPTAMAELSDKNINKGIVTKSGTTIQFVDEEKASLIIRTASENRIIISDDEESIEISDQHGNTLKLGAGGIEIMSASDIKIEANGKVEIAGQQVDVK